MEKRFACKQIQSLVIPKKLLEQSDKILFICYLMIGDFFYLQNYFKKLTEIYPHLKIDIWIDEYKGRSYLVRWRKKRDNILYDWLASTPYLNKIYKNIGPWWSLKKFLRCLKKKIILSLPASFVHAGIID